MLVSTYEINTPHFLLGHRNTLLHLIGFMPGRGTTDASFVVRRMQEI